MILTTVLAFLAIPLVMVIIIDIILPITIVAISAVGITAVILEIFSRLGILN